MNGTDNDPRINESQLSQLKSTVLSHAEETDKLCAAAAEFLGMEEVNIDHSSIIANIDNPLYRLLIQMVESYERLATAIHQVYEHVTN